jgi:photosystem II stability/assembly factor-like uncharacterized protein
MNRINAWKQALLAGYTFAVLYCLVFAGLLVLPGFAQEQGRTKQNASLAVVDLLDRPAVTAYAAAHSVLLGVTKAGDRLVAVGERGIIVYSDDGGRNWKQAQVPTSVSLTNVKFPTPKIGYVIGHGGMVLKTEDGGETWVRQLDGLTLAKLAMDYAQAAAASAMKKEAADKLIAAAGRLEKDGPDKPFLDMYFENETTGFVVGAYGLIFRTTDGGKNWTPWMDHTENPGGLHFYGIAAQGDSMYLAGEQGMFLRSTDKGNKFTRVETPYKGTYFTIAVFPTGEILLGGMKGNAYRSTDQGKTFKQVMVPIPVSFAAMCMMSDGTLVIANQAGMLMVSTDKGATIRPLPLTGLPPMAGLTDAGHGMVMTVGYAGAVPVPLNAAPSLGGM